MRPYFGSLPTLPRQRLLSLSLLLSLLLLAACGTPPSLPTRVPTLPAGGTPAPGTPAPQMSLIASTPAPAVPPSPTPVPVDLVICQTAEPLSLYLYGDDTAARAGILEALYDGPIDLVNDTPQPVILTGLPNLADGSLRLEAAAVQPGDRVVDADTWQVVQLAEGVHLAQVDGSVITYTGEAPAAAAQVSADFHLQPGVLWSDNQPLTADDSRFSFEAAAFYDTPASKFVTDRTLAYEVVDRLTTRWTGLPGWRDPQAAQRFWSPLPRHLFDGVSPSELKTNADANDRPLGWGPFQLQDWQKGDRLTLVRNPNYFRAGAGLPKVDRVIFRFGLTPDQILDEMKAGRCDIGPAAVGWTGWVEQLRADPDHLAPQFAPEAAFEHLDFGIQPAPDYRRAAGEDFFQDARARQALADCLDRQALIDQLLSGIGAPPASYVPAGHPLYAAGQVTEYPFDAARGRKLLADLGWTDSDGDGVRDRAGKPLSLDYVSGPEGSAFRAQLAQALQAQLRANCGVDLRLKWAAVDDPGQGLYAPWPGGPVFGRRFDLASFPWRAGQEPPCELYLSSAIPDDLNPAGANDLGYSNPEFDVACRRALAAYDPAERAAAHAAAQAIFTRDLPSLPLFFRFVAGVARPGVTGYRLDPSARSDLWNIEMIGRP